MEHVARYFGRTLRFAYGLWLDDLRNGLLWYVDVPYSKYMSTFVAPSWSWVSIRCQAKYNLLAGCRYDQLPPSTAFTVLDAALQTEYGRVHSAQFKVEAMTLETSSSGFDKKRFICLFDYEASEKAWTTSSPFTLVMICPWSLTRCADLTKARGLGLIGRKYLPEEDQDRIGSYEESDSQQSFLRAGIFLMDSYEIGLPGWTRKTLMLL
ncbi:hypothetical protein O1611_g7265 [Lasiodiplodia mahajangana]|uniref:Uncharacterized protein n=1 Tax=Lasiodiplodia mahajangana TaxID=1108764 RepID=A0ACC2JGL9_9PEZI|nr:hypothetical protein O1611_g7265 [Lasiodiplodia mahajangana]